MLVLQWPACTTGMQVQIRDVSVAERQEHMAKPKVCKGESWVHSMTGESPDKHDDQFTVYSTHTVDALKGSDIRVSVCIDGTMLDMKLD